MKDISFSKRFQLFVLVFLAAWVVCAGQAVAAPGKSASAGKKVEIKGEPPYYNLKVGVASYSLRKFSLDETIKMMKELDVKYLSLKSYHLPLDSTAEERKEAARKINDAGLELVSCGVITLGKDLPDMRPAFEYARDAGMPMIIGSFTPADLPAVEKLVKEFDIQVAIHNHGPGDKNFPSGTDVYAKVKDLDKRIGLCLDIGHEARLGNDEVAAIYKVKDRLLDLHIKDIDKRAPGGKAIEMGNGVLDIPGVVTALTEIGYTGHVNLEYEKDENNPLSGMKESFAYLRGVMAGLAARQ